MHIYIDESGDTGFKLDKGSSILFSITLIIFKNPKIIENIVKSIQRMMKKENIPQNIEWKFSKTNDRWKKLFFETINNYDFEIRSVVMIKKNISGPKLITDKHIFYSYTCKLLLQNSSDILTESKIIFDKMANRDFYTDLKKYLRNHCGLDHTKIKKIQHKDSKKIIPLQIADMVTGAIVRSFSPKKDNKLYYSMIENKITNIFKFPDDLKKYEAPPKT